MECTSPVLILEGEGDKSAVPLLIRTILAAHDIYDVNIRPHPILRQNIPKLKGANQLEKFVTYATGRDGDSVLVILDADKDCPRDVAVEFVQRTRDLPSDKKVGFAFFKCEFEVYFLYCLDLIAHNYPQYGWNLDNWSLNTDFESVLGAKAYLSRRMKRGRSYKETRDQAKFVSAIDIERLRVHSRNFRHFESALLWLRGDTDEELVYPNC